jgi:hypothetical protein
MSKIGDEIHKMYEDIENERYPLVCEDDITRRVLEKEFDMKETAVRRMAQSMVDKGIWTIVWKRTAEGSKIATYQRNDL